MAFTVKDWRDFPDTSTPLSAAAMEDTETRIKTEVESVTFRNYREYRPEDYGADPTGAGDSTTAFRDLMQDIEDSGIGGDVVLQPGAIYLLNGAPDHSKFGNAIVPLPLLGGVLGPTYLYPYPPQCLDVRIRSLGKGTATLKTTRTGDTYSGTWGTPSIVGGPTPEQAVFAQANTGNVYVEGVIFNVPIDPEISCLDVWYTQGFMYDGIAICTPESTVGTRVEDVGITWGTHKWTFGIRFPNGFNQGTVIGKDLYIQAGPYCGIVPGSHVQIRASIQFVTLAVGVPTGTGNGAEMSFPLLIVSDNKYHFAGWDETNGARSLSGTEVPVLDGMLVIEGPVTGAYNPTALLLDANDKFTGSLKFFYWATGPSNNLPTITGGANFNFRRMWPGYLHSSRGLAITGAVPGAQADYLELDMASADANGVTVNDPGTLGVLARVLYTTGDTQPAFAVFAGSLLGAGYHVWGPGGATGGDTTLYRAAANQLKSDDTIIAADGVATKTKAGTPVDADFATTPPVGTMVVDTTANKLWVRTGAATWKFVTLT